MSTAPSTLVLDRVLRVLQPLVRLLLRHGVTYPALAAALKRVFLDAARQELQQRGMASTDSAITLLSGVHRRDVRELSRGPRAAAMGSPAPAAAGVAAQVVARWMNDLAFVDAQGIPIVLTRTGEAQSFETLAQGVSSDVRPKAVADELLRLGVITETPEGLALKGSGFAPRHGFEEMAWLFAANLHDHAAAAVANMQGEHSFLEQAVFVDEISESSAAQLQQVSMQAWKQAFKTVMAQAQQRFDADAKLSEPEQRQHRARFGVYFYSERDDSQS